MVTITEQIYSVHDRDSDGWSYEVTHDPRITAHITGKSKLSDGGPSSYYDFKPDWKTLNDYIDYKSEQQWKGDSFHLGNIEKALCRWGDKVGTSKEYDAKKIIYSALRVLLKLVGKTEVKAYLQQLIDDPQFN